MIPRVSDSIVAVKNTLPTRCYKVNYASKTKSWARGVCAARLKGIRDTLIYSIVLLDAEFRILKIFSRNYFYSRWNYELSNIGLVGDSASF